MSETSAGHVDQQSWLIAAIAVGWYLRDILAGSQRGQLTSDVAAKIPAASRDRVNEYFNLRVD